jgi:hypothetical protein
VLLEVCNQVRGSVQSATDIHAKVSGAGADSRQVCAYVRPCNGLVIVQILSQSSVFDHLRSWNPAGGAL